MFLSGCGDGVSPETPLKLSIKMDSRVVSIGDSVRFIAGAYNPTDETLDVGSSCGSSLDVIVMPPTGEEVSVYARQLAGGVPTCEQRWYHEAAPGQLIELEFWWEAPDQRGTYRAATQIRCGDLPCPRSTSIGFKVQ
jgi:hypothetical protein